MNNIICSSAFLFWYLSPAQNALQVYCKEGGSAVFGQRQSPLCLITCLQFGDLNPSRD